MWAWLGRFESEWNTVAIVPDEAKEENKWKQKWWQHIDIVEEQGGEGRRVEGKKSAGRGGEGREGKMKGREKGRNEEREEGRKRGRWRRPI